MEIQSFKLISNNLSFGPAPKKSDEVEQHLTVSSSGRVWFSARNYEQYCAEKGFCRKKQLNIGKWKAAFLINLIKSIHVEYDVTDCGSWELTIKDSENTISLSGPLIGDEVATSYGNKPVSVTRILRRYIPVYGLMGFDSELSPDYEGKKAIHLFSKKWIDFFSAGQSDSHDFEFTFGEECISLGFQMDCGAEFNKQYPECFNLHTDNLKAVINDINDIDLLGSAVFSQWRYLTHWAWAYELDHDTRSWFILVLKRMKDITRKSKTSK